MVGRDGEVFDVRLGAKTELEEGRQGRRESRSKGTEAGWGEEGRGMRPRNIELRRCVVTYGNERGWQAVRCVPSWSAKSEIVPRGA